MYASIKYWVWLADLLPTAVGHRVYQFFNSPIEAFLAEPERYDLIPGLTRQQKELLCHASLDRADSILEECARKEIRVVTWQDADYPERLRSMPAPPLVVYAQGRPCHFDDEAAIAIAGTRRASPYGRRMAQDIASELTQMGSLVVTGIVAGCDLSAARGALETGQPLVCVLAGGVDVPYYQSESGKRLLAEIAEQGTLVSLSPPGTPHLGGLFRSRNELLVGLSLGVVCVEAGQRSGTLQVAPGWPWSRDGRCMSCPPMWAVPVPPVPTNYCGRIWQCPFSEALMCWRIFMPNSPTGSTQLPAPNAIGQPPNRPLLPLPTPHRSRTRGQKKRLTAPPSQSILTFIRGRISSPMTRLPC